MTRKKVYDSEVHSFSSYGTDYNTMLGALAEYKAFAEAAGATEVIFSLDSDYYEDDKHFHCEGYRLMTPEEEAEAAREREDEAQRRIESLTKQLARLKGSS